MVVVHQTSSSDSVRETTIALLLALVDDGERALALLAHKYSGAIRDRIDFQLKVKAISLGDLLHTFLKEGNGGRVDHFKVFYVLVLALVEFFIRQLG